MLFLCGVKLVLRSGVLTVLDLNEVDVTPRFAEVFGWCCSGLVAGGADGVLPVTLSCPLPLRRTHPPALVCCFRVFAEIGVTSALSGRLEVNLSYLRSGVGRAICKHFYFRLFQGYKHERGQAGKASQAAPQGPQGGQTAWMALYWEGRTPRGRAPSFPSHVHARTRTRMHTHTHAHTPCVHAYTYAHAHTYARTHIHTCTRTNKHARKRTHAHICSRTHAHKHTHTHTHTNTQTHTQTRTYVHARTHACIRM